jgi:hypothetical protein
VRPLLLCCATGCDPPQSSSFLLLLPLLLPNQQLVLKVVVKEGWQGAAAAACSAAWAGLPPPDLLLLLLTLAGPTPQCCRTSAWARRLETVCCKRLHATCGVMQPHIAGFRENRSVRQQISVVRQKDGVCRVEIAAH